MKKQNKFLDFIRRFHIIPKIVCFLLAFVFWIYVMQVDSPDNQEVFEDIPVTVMGTTALENERNLSIFSGYDTLLDITVKGKKSDVSRYSAEDIVATIDVSDIEKSGTYTRELFFDLPAELTFVKASTSEVSIFVDKRTTANIAVVPEIKSYKLSPTEYSLGDIVCDTDIISVTGPESVIKEISYASVVVNMGDEHLTQSVIKDGDVVLKTQNGADIDSKYLKLSKTSMQVTVPVYGYKDVPLRAIGKHGFYTKDTAQISVSPETVRIMGEPAVLETIDHLDITTLDEKTIGESSQLVVDITLPENVFAVEGQPRTATVAVELKGLTKKVFAVDNIVLKGADAKKFEILDESVAVTVLGDAAALKNLKAGDITLTVDLSSYTDVDGTFYPAATVSFDTNNGTVYEIGVYSIKVKAK